MKKNRTTFIMVLFFFMGLLILLYPSLSNFYNQKFYSKAIVDYEDILKKFNKENYEIELKKAEEYNLMLSKLKRPLYEYQKVNGYYETLKVDEFGMIGYISIPKIGIELPIFHGTSNDVLSKAAGHLEGTSLPVGGLGSHSAISAHRGLPSSKLFTDLDKLEIGDTFTISVLNRKLIYQIDQILIVNPKEISELKIDSNHDYVTLVTCTPYGINSHRLLVRGTRIEKLLKPKYITTEAFRISNLIVTPIVSLPIIFVLLLILIFKPVKKTRKNIYPTKIKKEGIDKIHEK